MSPNDNETRPSLSLQRVKPKRARTRRKAESEQPLAPREGLLAHAWVDRDLSWLEFNRRVLHEALDERTPLLERLKFLAIFTSNLDEFYMKRVGLLRGVAEVESEDDPVARTGSARDRLAQIRKSVLDLLVEQARCYQALLPKLACHGILLAAWDELTEAQRDEASHFFDRNVSPALTPLGLDPAHPFPFMSNLSTNWGFILRNPESEEYVPVRVKIPTMLPSWIPLKADAAPGERRFLRLEDLIRHSADKLFPGMEFIDASLFRILRNAEIELDEEEESLREAVTEALRQRRFEPVVRMDLAPDVNPALRQGLMERFELTEDDVYELPGLLDYTGLFQIAGLDVPSLRDPHWTPLPPPRLPDADTDIFAAIQAGDLLLHHPYDSFDLSVENFISDAAIDPQTVAIKMTVYRVGDDTPFVRSLIRAAEAGKQVACAIELKARFDEARNLLWAQELQKAGAHVTYGVMGLKTHTKVALVVRKEGHDLRCYAHVGTGNYHVKTARLYTDVGLLTCNPAITMDVVNLFHYLTGCSRAPRFEKLLVAPINMRQRFLQNIEREIEHHQAGRPARIVAKMNQVEDLVLARALSAASQAGVPVDLIVRGFCCLAPGVPGWTENVRVRSIIGRFLEHSRIFHFANGQEDPLAGEFYIGSADWMFRNLSRRVEAAAPVEDRAARERLWEILDICLQDRRQAWSMQPDGSYVRSQSTEEGTGPAVLGTHAWLMDLTRRRAAILP
ncbi:polyphosphate kinase 1 [Candidatus Competibacter phosphatis]|uniref:Polyphosphate kinase n=1 Tax=Candidatus Competibacter phosphatis TaxID=221280 RepID=A0ABX1TPE3_9GAMM|nr:polyphosphate kinase 1 [Candidatus Competibacter phosphatis]NMQ20551.1 polyphosphate kinase 1 [Candidatus Competibacter phosphatis]